MSKSKGAFTLPGESGYEALTLELAEKWGADVIRDSDGTVLSEEILNAGYGIYSTICIIRDHNEWAKQNPDKLQQTFLITQPVLADHSQLEIDIMKDFFNDQFQVNDSQSAMKYWEVYDRTTDDLLDRGSWEFSEGKVHIKQAIPFHTYTVSFMAYRIWEEISMYNHTTNNWNKEHLMQIDPIHNDTRDYLVNWLKSWCESHPDTTVVRFTSLFYNFVWIWGSREKNRHLFTDWGSYDFTVSPLALEQFSCKYGYELTAEDFVNKGKYRVTHMPADSPKRDWMDFVNDFVISFGKELIDIVHAYGKKAYVFYDDSWVGMEPYNGRFHEFGFDGLIKCVFSGYEARLCSGVEVDTHEIRLHPYLFPVGLGGAPTFEEGGDPAADAQKYWISVRRALVREKVDRIGLGGYLHLTEDFPDFCDYIEKISDEFREIGELHQSGKPYLFKPRVAVLHYWGKLRSWTLAGHFHETRMHDLIHINEALSGMPFDVQFINFDDVKKGALEKVDFVINAGRAGDAWSGGNSWQDDEIIGILNRWVFEGGVFLGINEPSAADGYNTFFRMASVLGIDLDKGERICHGRWPVQPSSADFSLDESLLPEEKKNLYLTSEETRVLYEKNGNPFFTINDFGKGKGIFLSSFSFSSVNSRFLLELILSSTGHKLSSLKYFSDNPYTECTFFPGNNCMVIVNNSLEEQNTTIKTETETIKLTLEPGDLLIKQL